MEINLKDGRKVTGARAEYNLANKASHQERREEVYSFSGGGESEWLAKMPLHNRRACAELLALDELKRYLEAQRGMSPRAFVPPAPQMSDFERHCDQLLPGPERTLPQFQSK